jgi:hypothetical protein
MQTIGTGSSVPTFEMTNMTMDEVKQRVWAGDVWGAIWANPGQSAVSSRSLYCLLFLTPPPAGLQRISYQRFSGRNVQPRQRVHLHRHPSPLLHGIPELHLPRVPGSDRYRIGYRLDGCSSIGYR